jgi:signal recognition particle GTPase
MRAGQPYVNVFCGVNRVGTSTNLAEYVLKSTSCLCAPAGQPYVIVFCGVNGVGKSTNLAKIAYWLGSQGLKVQLAACDTFRAGAVEQLKTHAAKLGGVSKDMRRARLATSRPHLAAIACSHLHVGTGHTCVACRQGTGDTVPSFQPLNQHTLF